MDRRALAADVYKVARGAGADNDMPQGLTPLMVASAKGHVHSMLLLIDRGAKIDAVNDLGQTALHLAALNGHAHAVKCLVAEGAESWHRDSNGCTPMDCAKSESEEHERCRLILDMAKPRGKVKVKVPDIQDVDGEMPAHHYLVQNIYGLPRSCASNGISPMPSPLPYPPHALHARSRKHCVLLATRCGMQVDDGCLLRQYLTISIILRSGSAHESRVTPRVNKYRYGPYVKARSPGAVHRPHARCP